MPGSAPVLLCRAPAAVRIQPLPLGLAARGGLGRRQTCAEAGGQGASPAGKGSALDASGRLGRLDRGWLPGSWEVGSQTEGPRVWACVWQVGGAGPGAAGQVKVDPFSERLLTGSALPHTTEGRQQERSRWKAQVTAFITHQPAPIPGRAPVTSCPAPARRLDQQAEMCALASKPSVRGTHALVSRTPTCPPRVGCRLLLPVPVVPRRSGAGWCCHLDAQVRGCPAPVPGVTPPLPSAPVPSVPVRCSGAGRAWGQTPALAPAPSCRVESSGGGVGFGVCDAARLRAGRLWGRT